MVAQAIFQSVLTYCISVWGGAAKREIQILQNTAAQFVLKLPGRSHRVEMFKRLRWLTVHQLVVFHRIMAVYNIRMTGEPEFFYKKLSRDNIRENIIVPNRNITLLKRSFAFHGAELWNMIPLEIRRLEKKKIFKQELKDWVLTNVAMFT